MKYRLLLLFLFLGTNFLMAQKNFYSYLTDMKFRDPTDLVGYNFVPSKLEVPNERDEELSPGDYTFGITRSNLYVQGAEISGVYNVNNIAPTEYGFKLTLMNSRDPRLQGHLKVILVNKVYVDALIFKPEKDTPEMIFLLPEMNDNLWETEKAFFTDKYEVELEYEDDVWGSKIMPFFRIYEGGNNVKERLQLKDSTSISFIEEVQIIDKTKPVKAKKKKKKALNIESGEIPEELESEEEGEEEGEMEEEEEYEEEMEEEMEEEEYEEEEDNEEVVKKEKIIKDYFIEIRSIRTNEDGLVEDDVKRYKVKKMKEREDQAASSGTERYQIEFETNKGMMYLYLTSKRTISSFEIGGERYLMRGH